MSTLKDGISWLVPPQHDRTPVTLYSLTWNTAPWLLLYSILSLLCRRPNTRLYRACLGPVLFVWGVRMSLGTIWFPQRNVGGNVVATMSTLVLSIRSLVFGLASESQKKTNEVVAGQHHLNPPTLSHRISWMIEDMLDISCAIRGVNFDFGTGSGLKIPVDKSTRQKYAKDGRRGAWILHTIFYRILPKFIVVDVVNSLNLTIVQIGGPTAFQDAHILTKLIIESWTFFWIVCTLDGGYDIASVFGVGIFRNDIANWPPMFDKPWLSTSLHEFWANRWHQFLRHIFLVTAGYPLQAVVGRSGLIFGAFLSSGLLHSIMLNGDGKTGASYHTIFFFTIQTLGLFLETLFRKATGKRVAGVWGRIWTIIFILGTGQGAGVEWADRGAMELSVVPLFISPTRYLLGLVL